MTEPNFASTWEKQVNNLTPEVMTVRLGSSCITRRSTHQLPRSGPLQPLAFLKSVGFPCVAERVTKIEKSRILI